MHLQSINSLGAVTIACRQRPALVVIASALESNDWRFKSPQFIKHGRDPVIKSNDRKLKKLIQVQRLKVLTAPPSIERFPGNSKTGSSGKKVPEFFVLRGDRLNVSCDVTRGIPFPQISWKRNTVRKKYQAGKAKPLY